MRFLTICFLVACAAIGWAIGTHLGNKTTIPNP